MRPAPSAERQARGEAPFYRAGMMHKGSRESSPPRLTRHQPDPPAGAAAVQVHGVLSALHGVDPPAVHTVRQAPLAERQARGEVPFYRAGIMHRARA